ncbi:MAG: alpha/beta fold hydrolase [Candidatus Promineifilaceae bacterium]
MPSITIDGRQLFYTKQGRASAVPDLLLLHGAGGSHLVWPAELRRLGLGRVYALDLPGHGRSVPPVAQTIGDYATIVLNFIKAIGSPHLVVAGHSMGGAIAQMIGLYRPSYLAGLVLIGTGARLKVTDHILGQITTDFEGTIAFLAALQWADDTRHELVAQATELLRDNSPEILQADFSACNSFDIMDQLEKIEVPTLVIVGAADVMTPQKYSRYLVDHIAEAHLVTIPDAGHMVFLEQPEATASAIAAFLRQLQSA